MPIWDKIAELTGHDDQSKAVATEQSGHPKDLPPPAPATEHKVTTSSNKQNDWHDKFRDLLDGGAATKREAEAERLRLERERIEKEQAALKAEEEAHSFRAKLKGIFKSDEEEEAERRRLEAEAEQKRLAAERAKEKEHSWTAKIKDVFDDDDDEEKERERQRLAEEAKRNQSFGARVRGIFSPDHTPAVEEKQTKTQKIFGILEGKDKEPPKERNWLHDHVNSALGGGQKAEKEEDALDKTIDLFQKHVLREGDQSNESAAEQAKDRAIASSIRKLAGHDKDKDK